MGIAIVVSGASFTNNIGRAYPPYFSDLVGFYMLGEDEAASAMNRAPGGGELAVAEGAIAYHPGYIEVGKAAGFNTGLIVPPEHTQVAIFRRPDTTNLFGLCGAWKAGTYTDSLLLVGGSGGNTIYQAAYNASVRGTLTETGLQSRFMMMAATRDAEGGLVARTDTAGEIVSSPYDYTGPTPASSWRISTSDFGTSASTAGMAAVALYRRALEAEELQDVYDGLKEMLSGRVALA